MCPQGLKKNHQKLKGLPISTPVVLTNVDKTFPQAMCYPTNPLDSQRGSHKITEASQHNIPSSPYKSSRRCSEEHYIFYSTVVLYIRVMKNWPCPAKKPTSIFLHNSLGALAKIAPILFQQKIQFK